MGKPKATNSKRKKAADSSSDTSFGTPKRSCSESRTEQKLITEFTSSGMAENIDSNDKLDQILAEIAELKSIPRLITDLKTTIEQLRGEVLDVTQQCKNLERNLEKERKKTAVLEQQVREARHQAQLALTKADDTEQWNRRSSVRILNLPDPFAQEPHRDCIGKVTEFLAHILNVPSFAEEHIDICHRVGKYSPDGPPRQVIVKFMRRTTKLEVMERRKRMPRGAPFIVEDLTKARLQLLQKARAFPGARNAWSRGGKIFARLWGDRIVPITDDTDWDRLHDQAMLSPEYHRGDIQKLHDKGPPPRHQNIGGDNKGASSKATRGTDCSVKTVARALEVTTTKAAASAACVKTQSSGLQSGKPDTLEPDAVQVAATTQVSSMEIAGNGRI